MYSFKYSAEGRMAQVKLECGADIAALRELDAKEWLAISCPTKDVRFDLRTLELMDTDKDGRVRMPEVLAAIDFLVAKGVDLDALFKKEASDETALAEVVKRQAELDKAEPTELDRAALAEWEAKGREMLVDGIGDGTPAAEAALAAVEPIINGYFTPAEDQPLVCEAPMKDLPLDARINLKYFDAIDDFRGKCVKPLFGEGKAEISYLEWKDIKAKFAPYRGWVSSKPVAAAPEKGALDDEERVLRYRLHLLEFLENYVNMRRLYDGDVDAVYQTGVLRIDGREMKLVFHVDSEAAHSALAAKSKCCLLYLKLTRPSEGLERMVCAVVTAGTVGGLYVGRNGVFQDRDGRDWEAVVTKVVEEQVSLVEAFWAPWKKIGEGIAGAVKKFLGDRQTKATATVSQRAETAATGGKSDGGGAAMASSVAAIGIGVGLVGAAFASLMAVVSSMSALQLVGCFFAIILIVSLPSVILTWFKLRQRDLGAVLNACGWAVNRPMYFSMRRAKRFTLCAKNPGARQLLFVLVIIAVAIAAVVFLGNRGTAEKSEAVPQAAVQPAASAAAPEAGNLQKGTVNE